LISIIKGKDDTKLGRKIGVLLLRQHQKLEALEQSYFAVLSIELHN